MEENRARLAVHMQHKRVVRARALGQLLGEDSDAPAGAALDEVLLQEKLAGAENVAKLAIKLAEQVGSRNVFTKRNGKIALVINNKYMQVLPALECIFLGS